MRIHREGYSILVTAAIILLVINFAVWFWFSESDLFCETVLIISIAVFILLLQFFRYPKRELSFDEKYVMAPADGKVVVIEKIKDAEYFKDKRIQVSVFMSPFNVHANWYPVSGKIKYLRYHYGKFLLAWNPKSSTENERTTVVIEKENKTCVMVKQIAGILARRIIYYPHENDLVRQGSELGFIKFGSRVDVLMPENAKIFVKLNEKVKGGITVLGELV